MLRQSLLGPPGGPLHSVAQASASVPSAAGAPKATNRSWVSLSTRRAASSRATTASKGLGGALGGLFGVEKGSSGLVVCGHEHLGGGDVGAQRGHVGRIDEAGPTALGLGRSLVVPAPHRSVCLDGAAFGVEHLGDGGVSLGATASRLDVGAGVAAAAVAAASSSARTMPAAIASASGAPASSASRRSTEASASAAAGIGDRASLERRVERRPQRCQRIGFVVVTLDSRGEFGVDVVIG